MNLFSKISLMKMAWLVINLYLIITFCMQENALENGELRTLLFMQVTVIAFPLGYCLGLVSGYLIHFQSVEIEFWLTILLIMLGGYIQWFIVFPMIWNKIIKN